MAHSTSPEDPHSVSEEGKSALISGIRAEARNEAERILSEAKRQAEQRIAYAAKQAQYILNEAEEKAKEQSEAAKRRVLSGLNIEIKRKTMSVREEVLDEVLEKVMSKLKALVKKPEYRAVLCNWIVEAAVGLGADSALVSSSAEERSLIDSRLLREAERKIKKITGKPVKLALSHGPTLSRQGVELTSEDNRTAYNNQVETRLLRNGAKIRQMVYESMFRD